MQLQDRIPPSRPGARRAVLASLLIVSTGLWACDVKPIINEANAAIQEATNALGNAAATLNDSSVSWQDTLKQLEAGLSTDAKNLIDQDIQGVISRTIDQGGVEFRCDVGFVNQQVAQDLLDIKAKLLGQTPPAAQPQFCQAEPEAIDLSQTLTTETFYGYNFDLKLPLQAKVVHANGTATDVPAGFVNIPTAYALTVTTAGLGLGPDTTSLALYYNGKPFHTVGILTPQVPTPVCEVQQVPPDRSEGGLVGPYFPPQVFPPGLPRADQDFAGHGPNIQVGAQLSVTSTQVLARLYMDARETQKDFTEVQGFSPWTPVYTADPGYEIDSVSTQTSAFPAPYVDHHNGTTQQPWQIHMGNGGLVSYFQVVGDQDGDDVGRASVAAQLNRLSIVVRQAGNCVSAQTLVKAIRANQLSALVANKLSPKLAFAKTLLAK